MQARRSGELFVCGDLCVAIQDGRYAVEASDAGGLVGMHAALTGYELTKKSNYLMY